MLPGVSLFPVEREVGPPIRGAQPHPTTHLRGGNMPEDFTEVRKAQDALVEAVQNLKNASVQPPGVGATVVTDFIVVTRNRGYDPDGDPFGFFSWVAPVGQEPHVSQMFADVLSSVEFIPSFHDEEEE